MGPFSKATKMGISKQRRCLRLLPHGVRCESMAEALRNRNHFNTVAKKQWKGFGDIFLGGQSGCVSISFDVRLLDFQMSSLPTLFFLKQNTSINEVPKSQSPVFFRTKKTGGHSGVTTNPKQCKNEVVVHSKSTIDLHLPFDPPKTRNLMTPIIA